jgi:hypothetical protein
MARLGACCCGDGVAFCDALEGSFLRATGTGQAVMTATVSTADPV